ncbi:MAG: M24 family metallopeptidase [Candidatus Peribacteria bacterium]|nr:M24 family metallopeptidase [Candidatus Peribacteria bacterium]
MELEFVAEHFIKTHNLRGAFKHYNGFPANLCLSVNDCVVHGEPSDYILKSGDLLKIDAGLIYEKGYSDSAISVVVGGEMANPLAYDLITVNKEALDRGIETIVPGDSMFSYGSTVANVVQNAGYKVLKHLTGHGVGVDVHERPYVFNYGHPDMKKQFYQPEMVLCFEPIIGVMSDDFYQKEADEGLYTKHGDLGSQWEYMLLITEKGYEVLSGIRDWD